jgi:dihydroorotase
LEARKRGVIFDSASGGRGRNLALAEKAISQGFYPDIISADNYAPVAYSKVTFSLLRPMSEYLSMGIPLMEVIRACTQTPAKLMGMENTIGTLAPGALADGAILKIVERPVHFDDLMGNAYEANRLFVPQMTVKAGRTMYRQIEFMF